MLLKSCSSKAQKGNAQHQRYSQPTNQLRSAVLVLQCQRCHTESEAAGQQQQCLDEDAFDVI
jgi:hypothetical protein